MENGLYRITFQGLLEDGGGACVVIDRKLFGADGAGGLFDGTCTLAADGTFKATMVFTVTKERMLIQGVPMSRGQHLSVEAILPTQAGKVIEQDIETVIGTVSAQVKKLRDI